MIMEALVLYSCNIGKGCKETAAQYYYTHPSLQEFVEGAERVLDKTVPTAVTQYVFPIYAMLSTQNLVLKLTNEYSISYNKTNVEFVHKKEF